MNSLNTFIIGFCVSCVVLGLLFILVPSGALNKPVKYIFSLCFVCCIIGTAVSLPSLDFSDFEKLQTGEILTEQNTAFTAQSVFCEALKSKNINFQKITVDTNKMNDGSIIISKITVYTSEEAERVLEVIGSDSYEVVIINE